MLYEVVTSRPKAIFQITLGIHRRLLHRHTFAKQCNEGIFRAHGEEPSVAIGKEAGDGLARLTEVKLSFHGPELNVKGGELLTEDLYRKNKIGRT